MPLHATGPFHIADSDGVTILDKDGPVATFGYGKRPSEECEANALEWLHRFEKHEDLVETNKLVVDALTYIVGWAPKDGWSPETARGKACSALAKAYGVKSFSWEQAQALVAGKQTVETEA